MADFDIDGYKVSTEKTYIDNAGTVFKVRKHPENGEAQCRIISIENPAEDSDWRYFTYDNHIDEIGIREVVLGLRPEKTDPRIGKLFGFKDHPDDEMHIDYLKEIFCSFGTEYYKSHSDDTWSLLIELDSSMLGRI